MESERLERGLALVVWGFHTFLLRRVSELIDAEIVVPRKPKTP